MNQILYYLCRHAVSMFDGWHPIPARIIAEQAGVSLSTARRKLRELKKDGLAVTICEVLDREESCLPYHGWNITSKAHDTEEYKLSYKEEIDICRQIFGESMFPKERE